MRFELVNVSMKDFEQRVVAWKEKEVIEATTQPMDASKQRDIIPKKEWNLSPESDKQIASSFTRMNQFNKVKFHPVKVSAGKKSNHILLELLDDVRFRPLPLVE